MKSIAEAYGKDAANIMRDLSMYKVLKKEQVLGLYPGREKVIEKVLLYLTKQRRIWKIDDYYCASPEAIDSIDTSLISAVWVLLDFIDQVSFHSAGDYPAKIIFYVDGEIYEILYAGFGNEALVTYLTSLQSHSDYSHIILLDSPEQIKELDIPNTCGYCTVSPTGRVRYYQKT